MVYLADHFGTVFRVEISPELFAGNLVAVFVGVDVVVDKPAVFSKKIFRRQRKIPPTFAEGIFFSVEV